MGARIRKSTAAKEIAAKPDLKLGLIGDNISESRAPVFHRLAGAQNCMIVQYDRLVPADREEPFDVVFDNCAARGYRGINITYPYKENAAKKVLIDNSTVAAIGAINTVLFESGGAKGLNTDYTGFIAAYRSARGDRNPGICCLIGTGGVGRALAFALMKLGADELRLVDHDLDKAEGLAVDLKNASTSVRIVVETDAVVAAKGAAGLLNGTPMGMTGIGGTPLSGDAMHGSQWAFDAVYTPLETEFLADATASGLEVISGYELFIYQGIHAWTHFSGKSLNETLLRAALLNEADI